MMQRHVKDIEMMNNAREAQPKHDVICVTYYIVKKNLVIKYRMVEK